MERKGFECGQFQIFSFIKDNFKYMLSVQYGTLNPHVPTTQFHQLPIYGQSCIIYTPTSCMLTLKFQISYCL